MGNVRTHTANVLVIGTGAAGLRAAIAAHRGGGRGRGRRQSGPASTPTRCSRREGSTPRSAPATRRTRGSSTSPTRWRRATCSAILASSRSWRAKRRRPWRSWPTGDAPSPAPTTVASISGSSARTAGGARATPATTRAGRSCRRWPPRSPSSASPVDRRALRLAAARRRRCVLRRASPSTCTTGAARRSWPTRSCCAGAATRASGGAARRAATRTSARRWRSRSRPGAV